MIATNCNTCCFMNKHKMSGVGCLAGQFCVTDGSATWAPGCCRMHRNSAWTKQAGQVETIEELITEARDEAILRFTLLVLFDKKIHTLEDLKLTLDTGWYKTRATNVILADTTGMADRLGDASRYFIEYNKKDKPIPLSLDISTDREPSDQTEKTIMRLSPKIKDRLFMVVPAGQKGFNLADLATQFRHYDTRVLMWKMPIWIGYTPVVDSKKQYGLYLTNQYKTVVARNENRSFREQLKIEEEVTGIELTATCVQCGLTNDPSTF